MEAQQSLSWNTYADSYDMLIQYNPFYQKLHEEVIDEVKTWNIKKGDKIADIGAGTGNYSISMARLFPTASILHVDNDEGMNKQAYEKKRDQKLKNLQIIYQGIDEIEFQREELNGLISIHALYTFKDPLAVLRKMNNWLIPGSKVVLVNAGRMVNVLDWQLAIAWKMIQKAGLIKTIQILKEGKEVSRQNAYIRDMQKKGIFWTHSHLEFCETVEAAGFTILHSRDCFRGISDFVVAEK